MGREQAPPNDSVTLAHSTHMLMQDSARTVNFQDNQTEL